MDTVSQAPIPEAVVHPQTTPQPTPLQNHSNLLKVIFVACIIVLVLGSLGWFVVSSSYAPVHTLTTASQSGLQAIPTHISTSPKPSVFFPPLDQIIATSPKQIVWESRIQPDQIQVEVAGMKRTVELLSISGFVSDPAFGTNNHFENVAQLKNLGWQKDPELTQQDATRSTWGYSKQTYNKKQILLFSFYTTPLPPSADQKVVQYRYALSLSQPY